MSRCPRPAPWAPRRIAAGVSLGIGAALGMATPAGADVDVVTVDDAGDSVPGPCNADGCDLREAILQTNDADPSTDVDRIVFHSSVTGEITLNGTQLPIIRDPLTIEGPGAATLAVDGNDASRILYVLPDVGDEGEDVTISGLTLRDGMASGTSIGGGAIVSVEADMTLLDTVVSGNSATGNDVSGGAIAAYGTGGSAPAGSLTIRNSTLSGNSATGPGASGGAVYSTSDDVLVENSTLSGNSTTGIGGGAYFRASASGGTMIRNSTVSGNAAANPNFTTLGGGLYLGSGATTIESSTISGNAAAGGTTRGYGGGIHAAAGAVVIDSSTITGNVATGTRDSRGGGIFAERSTADPALINTIVANNSVGAGGAGPDLESFDDTFQLAFSLVESAGGVPLNDAVPGSIITGQDPQLAALAPNGGSTMTHIPAATSPAIDRGATGLSTDQRGLPRPSDFASIANSSAPGADGSDIGAVELSAPPAAVKRFNLKAAIRRCKRKFAKGTPKRTRCIRKARAKQRG